MDAIVILSDDSGDSYTTFLADVTQKSCKKLDCNEVTAAQGECEEHEHNQHFPVQNPLSGFDKETLIQNTIYILSKEMFMGSTYDYTIIDCHENSHLSTVSVQKRTASITDLHRPWEQKDGIPIRLLKTNSCSVLRLSDLQTMKEQCPPPAHRRSTIPATSVDTATYIETTRQPQQNENFILAHQNQENTLTQLQPLDLTTKPRLQCMAEASIRAQVNNVHMAPETKGEQHLNSDNQRQQDVNLALGSDNNLNEELHIHPSTFDESLNCCINSDNEAQSTENSDLHFCICVKETEDNKSEISCHCLNSKKSPVLLEDNPKNVTTEEDAGKTSRSAASGITEVYGTLQNEIISQLNEGSNENMFDPVCKPKLPSHWCETFIVVSSDNESDNPSLSFDGQKDYSVSHPKPKAEDKIRTVKSVSFSANSNEESSSLDDTAVAEQYQFSHSLKEILNGHEIAMPNNNLCAINKYGYGSKLLPADNDTENTNNPQMNETYNIFENMAMSSQMNNARICGNEFHDMSTAKEAADVSLEPKQDSNGSVYLSDDYYSDSDIDIYVCNKTKPQKTKTNELPLATWTVTNITDPLTSLKIKLCRTLNPSPESSQRIADNVEAESRSSTEGLASAPERQLHAFSDSETVTKNIEHTATENKEDTFSCMAYPDTPEISHAGPTFSQGQLMRTNVDIQKSSTPFIAKPGIFTKANKVMGADKQRSRQESLPCKQYKCQDTYSVFNTGFLVDNGKTKKTNFNEVDSKAMQPLSLMLRHGVMLGTSTATDKMSSQTIKRKNTFLQSLKHKFYCGKSNVSFLNRAQNSEKPVTCKGCKTVTCKGCKTVDLLNLQDMSKCNHYYQTTEPGTPNIGSSHLLNCNNKHESRKVSQEASMFLNVKKSKTSLQLQLRKKFGLKLSDNKHESRKVSQEASMFLNVKKSKTPLQLQLRKKFGLKLSEPGKETSAHKDLFSFDRKRAAEKNMNSCSVAPTFHKASKPDAKTKVAYISRVPNRNIETSESLKVIKENKSVNILNKSPQNSAPLMMHKSGQSFKLPKVNQAQLVKSNRRRLTLQEIFAVKKQSIYTAQMLAAFMHDRTAGTFLVRNVNEMSKEMLFYLCSLCNIKVTTSDSDNSTVFLHKLKNSRLPTESDLCQVSRRTRRQYVQEQ